MCVPVVGASSEAASESGEVDVIADQSSIEEGVVEDGQARTQPDNRYPRTRSLMHRPEQVLCGDLSLEDGQVLGYWGADSSFEEGQLGRLTIATIAL